MKSLFTSECVTCGHPDKVCDAISDSILDAYLDGDSLSRVAVETMVCQNRVIVAGEVTSATTIDSDKIIRDAIEKIGYDYEDMKFNYKNVVIENYIHAQSPDIAMGVDVNGAGDQGIMFGGACSGIDKQTLMPDCWRLSKTLADVLRRTALKLGTIRPDGKTQVTLDYTNPNKPKWDTIVVSVQHNPELQLDELKKIIVTSVIGPVVYAYKDFVEFDESSLKLFINPTGRFVIGGPDGDTGITGRKIVVDGYGGYYPVGGGAFSGKDPTKVDRSAAYMARYIAYNIVSAGLGRDCEVQLSYAIGVPQPTSVRIKIDGKIRDDIGDWIIDSIKMDPASIIQKFDLRRMKKLFNYADLAMNGHFGRTDIKLPWETYDLLQLETLKK